MSNDYPFLKNNQTNGYDKEKPQVFTTQCGNLREINFGHTESHKTVNLTILEAPNLKFLRIFLTFQV